MMSFPRIVFVYACCQLMGLLIPKMVYSSVGDTTIIQTFTFGSSQDGWFQFPSDTMRYERILMYYTLRCVPGNNPSCGEWDYLTYTNLYKPTGTFDSNITSIDTVLHDTTWNVFEVNERFELGRYITPYGFGLNLGLNGWTWVYDVSDYKPLLHDSIHLNAGNWQEELDLKFIMIEGTPPRDVIKIENVWSGGHNYDTNIESDFLFPKTILLDSDAVMARLKIRTTGHGFGGTLNCSEFCPRSNPVIINGTDTLLQYLWRICGLNPLYPQGGTWLYDRANWCPGAEVKTDDFELTPWVVPGDSITLDYSMEQGYVWDGQGSTPYYVVEGQLVTYGPPNFINEASIEEILAPNTMNLVRRYNPVCDNPIIRIRNNGTATLNNLHISYGPLGQAQMNYDWTGNLGFLETDTIYLPSFQSETLYLDSIFSVVLSNPNLNPDENPNNDIMTSEYLTADITDSFLVLGILSNAVGEENWWKLEDVNGNILYSVDSLIDNTYSLDTFNLVAGCYTFTIGDRDGDGLSFFASPDDGNGWLKFAGHNNQIVKHLNPNFGRELSWNFLVDPVLAVKNPVAYQSLEIFPNPASTELNIRTVPMNGDYPNAEITDLAGKWICSLVLTEGIPGEFKTSLPEISAGVYLFRFHSGESDILKKIVIAAH